MMRVGACPVVMVVVSASTVVVMMVVMVTRAGGGHDPGVFFIGSGKVQAVGDVSIAHVELSNRTEMPHIVVVLTIDSPEIPPCRMPPW